MSLKMAKRGFVGTGSVSGTGSTDRVRKLNAKTRETPGSVCLHRARAYTEVYRNTESSPPVLRRAMATVKSLDTMPPYIMEGELIIGDRSCGLKKYPLHPELESDWIMMEGGLTELANCGCTPEQAREFNETIYPYWGGKTLLSKYLSSAPQFLVERTLGSGFIESGFALGLLGSHGNPDWEYILKNGLNGYKKRAQEKLDAWDYLKAEDLGKNHFYQAAIMVLEAIERFSHKYAEHARDLAAEEKDQERKSELERIADICDRVPHEAPRTFHEALQALWFVLCAWHLEGGAGTSLGRFDQYMYPFYKKDIESGVLKKEEAQELLECLWIKLTSVVGIGDSTTAKFLDGAAVFHNTQVGGVDKYGNDATNELSYLCIDALISTHTVQPHLSVRLYEGSPEEFRMKMVDLIAEGMGHPSIYNDAIAKQIMLSVGADPYDANDYNVAGCMELGKRGGYWWSPGCWMNLGMAVEMTFTNGTRRSDGKRISMETGDPRSFKTYEEFEIAVEKHLDSGVDFAVAASRYIVETYQDFPVIIQSVLQHSGLERGLPFHSGGCYSSSNPGIAPMGIPDIGNSLAAVKKLVYDEKRITMDQLCTALDHNFEGYEEIRQMCLQAPKYGNDDDYVDRIEQRIIDHMFTYVKLHVSPMTKRDPDQATAKIRHQVGMALAPISGSVGYGLVTGALPSGRKAGEPLGDSCAPYMGTDIKGPTAALRSVAKIPHSKSHGTITNVYLTKDSLRKEANRYKLSSLIRGYFDQGGAHIQFNTIDKDILRDAQVHPEKYPTLLVRVAGYSSYFVDLSREVQDAILARTEHQV